MQSPTFTSTPLSTTNEPDAPPASPMVPLFLHDHQVGDSVIPSVDILTPRSQYRTNWHIIRDLRARLVSHKRLVYDVMIRNGDETVDPYLLELLDNYITEHESVEFLHQTCSIIDSTSSRHLSLGWKSIRDHFEFIDLTYLFLHGSESMDEEKTNEVLIRRLNHVVYFGSRNPSHEDMKTLESIRDAWNVKEVDDETIEPMIRNKILRLSHDHLKHFGLQGETVMMAWCVEMCRVIHLVSVNDSKRLGDQLPGTFFQVCISEHRLSVWLGQICSNNPPSYINVVPVMLFYEMSDFVTWKLEFIKQSQWRIYDTILRLYTEHRYRMDAKPSAAFNFHTKRIYV